MVIVSQCYVKEHNSKYIWKYVWKKKINKRICNTSANEAGHTIIIIIIINDTLLRANQ